LSEEGLAAAVETLVERSPSKIEIAAIPEERLPPAVEATVYLAISEAVKSARDGAQVDVRRYNGRLVAVIRHLEDEVSDPDAEARLRDIVDRVAALDGQVSVERRGSETVVRAEIPCA
jgi:signal transduction histidine kinase